MTITRKFMRGTRYFAAVSLTAIAIACAAEPASAQWIVFDPTNYVQNVLTAARALQQINNQLQSLANEATMLSNQARNLTSLPYSSQTQLDQSISATQQLLNQAQNIVYSVNAIDQAFSQTYPQSYSGSTSSLQLLADAEARWVNARAGFEDAMNVQAGAVQNLDSTRTQVDALVSASQSAAGALQAAQSGNQLTAIQTKQLADATAVLAAIARAQSLDGAQKLEDQLQAEQQMQNFLNYGPGYQPGDVEMFH